jgi:hypothetical protein
LFTQVIDMSQQNVDWDSSNWDSPADDELRDVIRARIRLGRLPNPQGHRLFGGKGDGALCACCDRFITSSEIQFDIESRRADGWVSHAMHLECFELWRIESRAASSRRVRELAEVNTATPS